VTDYLGTGLERGEAAIVIATPEQRAKFSQKLAPKEGQVTLLDAEETLARFMTGGMPQWKPFHEIVGGAIAELRLHYPALRAYSGLVDVLWQKGEREAAIRLEEYWNELAKLHTFSLLCGYCMDNLDSEAYGGPLESVCKVHTHLIPARDYSRFNHAVDEAAKKILGGPLAQILLSLSANHRPATRMPHGQAALFWLRQNMPRTAEKVISEVRALASTAGR
jgi:MEDS: MEthanogen/methylotroph, DcmR Sensory domain